jgi:isopentenyl diphosphate isomerase/L-lactate dehydrogenase-like FMN-dependent dehydrogenase
LWPDGEVALMRAAEVAGIPFTLSTFSICSIEQLARAASRPFWFQLYVMRIDATGVGRRVPNAGSYAGSANSWPTSC